MPLDFSEFTMPVKKKAEPAPRRIIVPTDKGDHLEQVRQELVQRGQAQPVSNNQAPGERQCKRVPWTPPVINEIDESEYIDGIPVNEWQVIQAELKPKRKPRKSKAALKTVAAQPRKKKRPPAVKIEVVCTSCNNPFMEYPSNIPPMDAMVGSGYRCAGCLSRK